MRIEKGSNIREGGSREGRVAASVDSYRIVKSVCIHLFYLMDQSMPYFYSAGLP